MIDMDITQLKIKREPGRFYVTLEGHDSYLVYKLINGVVDVIEVQVHEAHRGQGIAAELCKAAVEFAKQHIYKIYPTCPYMKDKFLPERPELKELVVEGELFYKAKKK